MARKCLEEARELLLGLPANPGVDLHGWVTEETVFRYLASADLGLDLARTAICSRSLSNMAFGSPVVAFDVETGSGPGRVGAGIAR